MRAHVINTEESKNKRWAAQDRRMRNLANATHYSYEQRTRAERMRMALTLCYAGIVYEPSYGTTGVSIKVTGFVTNRRNLRELEADWAAAGVIKKESPQGTLYRFKK